MDIPEQEKERGRRIVKKYERLARERTNWDNHWDELAKHIIPEKDIVFNRLTTGERRHNLLYDSTAIHANELLSSALHGSLTSPTAMWFELTTGDRELDKKHSVRIWLDDTARRIIRVLNNSNFHTEVHEVYLDLGAFGTALMRVEKDDEFIVRFHARPIFEAYVSENSRGLVDTVYRKYHMTLMQIVDEFGIDALDDDHRRILENDPERKVEVIHAVEPRQNRLIERVDAPNMPFASTHVLVKNFKILKEKGFEQNPYIVPRWSKVSGEVYGRSPGMKALPEILMANEMMRTVIRAAQKATDPPLMSPDDGVLLPIKTSPNSVNYYRAGTKDRIEPLVHKGKIDIGAQLIEETRMRIRQAFFIDQLQLSEDNPQMTATEVLQRTEEKLRLLGPVLGRQHFEFLRPLINRVFAILQEDELLLPPPDEVPDSIDVRYSSMIAKAQKSTEAENYSRLMTMLAPFGQMHPELYDNFDGDDLVRQGMELFSLPSTIIKPEKVVAQTREERAKAQAQANQNEQDTVDAQNMNKMGVSVGGMG